MMKGFSFPFFMGFRNFFSVKKGAGRSMLGPAAGMALAIIPLVLVIEISDGMIEGITRRFIEIETGHLHLRFSGSATTEELEYAAIKAETDENVIYAAPVHTGTGILYSGAEKAGVQLKALPPDIYERDSGMREYLRIMEGVFSVENPDSIMLSRGLASALSVGTGDSVKLLTAKRMRSGRMIYRPEAFSITGIFDTGYHEVDAMSAYINIDRGERLFADQGGSYVMCKVSDPYADTGETAVRLGNLLGPDARIFTWYQLRRSMYETFNTTKILLVLIMGVILVVASVNITSSMIIMIMERQQDIAILKSMGASGAQVMMMFLVSGVLTGIAGAAAGTAAGALLSININGIFAFMQSAADWLSSGGAVGFVSSGYYLDRIPVDVSLPETAAVFIAAVLLSALASYVPASRAAGMSPLEIIRKH